MSLVIYGHHFAVQARLILYFTFLIVKLDSAKKNLWFLSLLEGKLPTVL